MWAAVHSFPLRQFEFEFEFEGWMTFDWNLRKLRSLRLMLRYFYLTNDPCPGISWSSGRFGDILSRRKTTNRYSILLFCQDGKRWQSSVYTNTARYVFSNVKQVRYYVEHCSLGDWLVLYQMARNMNKRFFAEFLYVLARLSFIFFILYVFTRFIINYGYYGRHQ